MATDTAPTSRTGPSGATEHLGTIRASKPLQGVVFGVALIGIGLLLQVGPVAGMMGIYGATAIVVSVAAHVTLTYLRRESN